MGPDAPSATERVAVPVLSSRDEALVSLGRTLVALLRRSGRIVRILPSCAEIVGLSPSRLTGRPFTGLVPAGERPAVRAAIEAAFDTGRRQRVEHRLLWAGGERTCLSHLAPCQVAGERFVHLACTDIAPVAAARDVFEGEQRLLAAVLEHVDEAILGLTPSGRIVACSQRAGTLLGWAHDELLGRRLGEVLGDDVRVPLEDGPVVVDLDHRRPDGRHRPVRLRFRAAKGGGAPLVTLAIEPRDDAGATYERLVRLARTDPLTGVRNRADTLTELSRWIADAPTRPFYVAYIDLDDFKTVNDTGGHAAGDALLARVGRALRASVRSQDLVGRVGGDEFVAGLRDVASHEAAVELAGRILRALGHVRDDAGRPVRASVGLAVHPADGHTPEALLATADAAMYAAKRAGGHTVRTSWASDAPDSFQAAR